MERKIVGGGLNLNNHQVNAALPKIIHQIVGPSPSPLIERCIKSWQALKPHGFEIRHWNDNTLREFIENNYPFILPAFENARNYAEASDIARYLIIYHFGGYYFDWDVQLLNPEGFLKLTEDKQNGFLVQDPVTQTLAPEAFSGLAGEPFLYKIVENIDTIYSNNFRHTMNTPQYSGPSRMRDVYYFMKGATRQQAVKLKDVFVYDYWEIKTKPPRVSDAPMIHYWAHGWIT